MIKIAFFDIDGTLIDMNKKKITEKMLETLKKLKENGIKICISTGRPPIAVPKFEGVEFDAYLTYNGSLCYSGDEIILSNSIVTEDVQQIVRNTAEIGRPVALSTRNNVEANGSDQDLSDYFGICGQKIPQAEDFEGLQNHLSDDGRLSCVRLSTDPQRCQNCPDRSMVGQSSRYHSDRRRQRSRSGKDPGILSSGSLRGSCIR